MNACANGDLTIVEILLKNGADVTVNDERESTALHHAAQRGHFEIIDLLIQAKADVNARDRVIEISNMSL